MNALLEPAALLLALLLPLAWLARRRRGAPTVAFAPAWLLRSPGPLPRSLRAALLPLPRLLAAAGLLCGIVALARPVRREPLPLESEGLDILLCLDVSSSMTAKDLDPRRTRLALARDAAAGFVRGRPHDRIGLLAFARYPDLRCPLTRDHEALGRILAGVETVAGDGPEDATGIGTAVARAAQLLRGGAAKSKVAILLTDGGENVATTAAPGEIAPGHAAQLCETLGIRVHAISVGAGGGAPRGEGPLESLARRTGGGFHAAADAGAVAAVYGRIDALEKTRFEERRFAVEERYRPLVLSAIALLLLARLLGATALRELP